MMCREVGCGARKRTPAPLPHGRRSAQRLVGDDFLGSPTNNKTSTTTTIAASTPIIHCTCAIVRGSMFLSLLCHFHIVAKGMSNHITFAFISQYAVSKTPLLRVVFKVPHNLSESIQRYPPGAARWYRGRAPSPCRLQGCRSRSRCNVACRFHPGGDSACRCYRCHPT